MGKRAYVLIALSACILLAGLAWELWPAPEPSYQGKPLSHWLAELSDPTSRDNQDQARLAIRHIGMNAIPSLLRMLRAHDSPLRTRVIVWGARWRFLRIHYTRPDVINRRALLGFQELNPVRGKVVPYLAKILDGNYSVHSQWDTMMIIANIRDGAGVAIPSLLRAAASTNESIRAGAVFDLAVIHSDAATVVPALITALHDFEPGVRGMAAKALANYGREAKPAVPVLLQMRGDPGRYGDMSPDHYFANYQDVWVDVDAALKKISPETYANAVTNATPPSPRF